MSEIILDYDGVIDEFIGDAILVIFGVPIAQDKDVDNAISCSIAMQMAMDKVNKRAVKAGYPELEMGIAVNTGSMVVGNIGSEKRSKYGVVGKEVNLTARMESFTLGGQIIISDKSAQRCNLPLQLTDEQEILPKGSTEPVKIYQLKGIQNDQSMMLDSIDSEVFIELPEYLKVEVFPMKNKMASSEAHTGYIHKINQKRAVVNVSLPEDVSTSLQLSLFDINNQPISTQLFAKIIEAQHSSQFYTLHFTYLDEQTKQYFKELLHSS